MAWASRKVRNHLARERNVPSERSALDLGSALSTRPDKWPRLARDLGGNGDSSVAEVCPVRESRNVG